MCLNSGSLGKPNMRLGDEPHAPLRIRAAEAWVAMHSRLPIQRHECRTEFPWKLLTEGSPDCKVHWLIAKAEESKTEVAFPFETNMISRTDSLLPRRVRLILDQLADL